MIARPARPNTIKRSKNQARLVITLEVECDMSDTPSWQSDAISVLRALDLQPNLDGFTGLLKDLGVTVISQKCEVAK